MKHLAMGIAATMIASTSALAGHHGDGHHDKPAAMSAENLVAKSKVDYLASESLGKDVYNKDMKKIASITDMGLTQDGEVAYIVLNVDGIENLLENNVAVPHDAFMWNESKDKLILNMTQKELANVGK